MTRTRIAPSPTGENLHIGNLYTALMNYAYAKKQQGNFIIRIEDTDRERFVEGAEERILQTVRSFGLRYDEGPDIGGQYSPYRQSERLALYKEHALKLIASKHAYYCFCSKERLDSLRKDQIAKKQNPRYDRYCLVNVKNPEEKIANHEPYVIRLKIPNDTTITFTDVIRGEISFSSQTIDDQVLLKSDGFPTYHLGVVVDDHMMKITHIIRAEEWITSTPKHVLLYNAFGWDLPIFAHMPILRNPDKSKLSKRKNPVWASWYLEEGYLPEAIINFLALMGWSHPEEKDIFSFDEFVSLFDIKDIKAVGPIFDLKKLTWMNQQYIQNLSDDALFARLQAFYMDMQFDDDMLKALIPLVKTRMQTIKDFAVLTKHFFAKPENDPRNDTEKDVKQSLSASFQKIDTWEAKAILESMKVVLQEKSFKMPVLYYLLTGEERGLPLPESLVILGKEKTLSRLQ